MIFGYTFAVIVGFLFTAGSNWTRQPTPRGAALGAICAAWVLARIFALSPWPLLSLAFDLAFALAAAVGLGIPLWKARNTRNYFFVALLLAVGALNVAFHLALLDRIDVDLGHVIELALDVVLFIAVVMAGRVVPMFTNNAIPGAGARRVVALERIALGSVLALMAADLLALPEAAIAVIAGLAAIAHAARLALWNPWATRAKPILGSCTRPTRGSSCTWRSARRAPSSSCRTTSPSTRSPSGRSGAHARHDDAHRARAHGTSAGNRRRGNRSPTRW
jgi:uncharacterized protein involved in response to NO